jgi:GABA permease
MWLYPVLPILVTATIVAVLVSMGLRPEHRIELFQGLAVWAALTVVYVFTRRARRSPHVPAPPPAERTEPPAAPQRITH